MCAPRTKNRKKLAACSKFANGLIRRPIVGIIIAGQLYLYPNWSCYTIISVPVVQVADLQYRVWSICEWYLTMDVFLCVQEACCMRWRRWFLGYRRVYCIVLHAFLLASSPSFTGYKYHDNTASNGCYAISKERQQIKTIITCLLWAQKKLSKRYPESLPKIRTALSPSNCLVMCIIPSSLVVAVAVVRRRYTHKQTNKTMTTCK